jgi:hypothetical protein
VLNSMRMWLAGIVLGLLIHLDWHLGRPGHHSDLSFSLPFHWLFAIPVFAGVYFFANRHWPTVPVTSAALIVALGALFGQGLEPLYEVVTSPPGYAPFANTVRWRVFGEFLVAGLLTLGLIAALDRQRRQRIDAR